MILTYSDGIRVPLSSTLFFWIMEYPRNSAELPQVGLLVSPHGDLVVYVNGAQAGVPTR